MDHCVTPGSSGSDTDGNGGCLVHTMLQSCRLQSSSPTGSQLMSQFDATTNGGDSGSSSPLLSSTSRDLELDESHNSNLRSGGGSSHGSNNRRSGFCQFYQRREDYRETQFQRNCRYHELNSWSRRHAQGAGPSIFQQRQQLPFPSNIQQGQQYTHNNVQLPQYPHHMTPPAYMAPWVAAASPPSYTYAPAMVTIPPPYGMRRSPVYPPPGITIRHPCGSPAPPPRRSETPVVIRAPPVDEAAGTTAPKQAGTPPPLLAPPEQPETPAAPPDEQPEPASGQESFVLEVLYGPSTSGRPRLPVFRDICPGDDEAGQASPPRRARDTDRRSALFITAPS